MQSRTCTALDKLIYQELKKWNELVIENDEIVNKKNFSH